LKRIPSIKAVFAFALLAATGLTDAAFDRAPANPQREHRPAAASTGALPAPSAPTGMADPATQV
jgi:hypothetical protein